ncbi:alpha/beta fold hydrolase [Tropicimonas isoalkanivorans]|uniref:alpha/beta fold hydrolase n=1 Tax=Tropicimonas isoalkanivorans TaxID=441112 RepID=UPI001FE11130|nr:alpha/beta hydrolase [Tropicimonas isoalkanivorans]
MAPEGAAAFVVEAEDGIRLRLAYLAPPPKSCRGTALIFPGRTEFVEKYGPAAAELQDRGFACVSIDWRGQGLSQRLLDDPATGHVTRFTEYQHDVDALMSLVDRLRLPGPIFLIAHSMGGAIGLRALHRKVPISAVAFSAPMWGIKVPVAARPLIGPIAAGVHAAGFGTRYVPSTRPVTYIAHAPFEDNTLTTDRGMFDWMKRQAAAHPELALGGPSITWLNEALRETRELRRLTPPRLPCLAWVGGQERIVETRAIRRLVARWPGAELTVIPEAAHELMMELPPTRDSFFDACAALFSRAGGTA